MSTHTSPSPRPRIFYGYWLVAFTCLSMLISSGGSFAYSLFVQPLQETLGWNRGEIMVGLSILFLMMGAGSPLAGRMVDRRGAKPVIVVGAVVMGLGFVVLGMTSSLPLYYFGYMLVGLGAGGIGSVPCSAIVSNWFKKKRGLAIGVMSSGIGLGGLVMAPVVGSLIEAVGFRGAYFSMAVIVWVSVIPAALLLVRTRPSEMGLYPDGALEAPAAQEVRPGSSAGLTLGQACCHAAFWLLAVTYFLQNYSVMGGLQSQGPNLVDLGFSPGVAAAALGTIGFGSAAGKLGFGWLCDKISPKAAATIGLLLQAGGLILVLRVGPGTPTQLIWTYSLMMGLGAGSWLPTLSILTSRSFGLAHYGSIFGLINLLLNLGTATGPLTAGIMYDAMGTYQWAFVLFAALHAISIPAVLLVRRPASYIPA